MAARGSSDPKKGHHVINNSVLNFYKDVVRTFVSEELQDTLEDMKTSKRLSTSSNVYKAIEHPVPDNIAKLIGDVLVVSLDKKRQDVDENARLYGENIKPLRTCIGSFMKSANGDKESEVMADSYLTELMKRNISDAIHAFLNGDYFIDEPILKIWKEGKSEAELKKFGTAKNEVYEMFRRLEDYARNDTLIQWVEELRKAARR